MVSIEDAKLLLKCMIAYGNIAMSCEPPMRKEYWILNGQVGLLESLLDALSDVDEFNRQMNLFLWAKADPLAVKQGLVETE